jgi:agmatine deiminase
MDGDTVTIDDDLWPGRAGFRMPAEWEPHQATWLSWPHNRETWPNCFDAVEPAMVEVVAALAESEVVEINVLDAEHRAHVEKLLAGRAPSRAVRLHPCRTNDAWVRDHGAIFVVGSDRAKPRIALDFDYNAWGGKYPPYDDDRRVAAFMAEVVGVPRFSPGIVLEGGSIEVNGGGDLLTTEQCLLNPNRNPELRRDEIETILRDTLGVRGIHWLGDGIDGDDTDGHIDDLTRFVAERTVVTVVEPNVDDPNHAPLEANRRRLERIDLGSGSRLEVVELPMPEPLYNGDERLPASYANFYVANDVVLVPAFACAADRAACEILGACFPGRRIAAIDCRVLVAGLGALHCLTQQVPREPD